MPIEIISSDPVPSHIENLGDGSRLVDGIYKGLRSDPGVYTPDWVQYCLGRMSQFDRGQTTLEGIRIFVATQGRVKTLDELNVFARSHQQGLTFIDGYIKDGCFVHFPMATGNETLWRTTYQVQREEVENGSLERYGLSIQEELHSSSHPSTEHVRQIIVTFLPGQAAVKAVGKDLRATLAARSEGRYSDYRNYNYSYGIKEANSFGLEIPNPPRFRMSEFA